MTASDSRAVDTESPQAPSLTCRYQGSINVDRGTGVSSAMTIAYTRYGSFDMFIVILITNRHAREELSEEAWEYITRPTKETCEPIHCHIAITKNNTHFHCVNRDDDSLNEINKILAWYMSHLITFGKTMEQYSFRVSCIVMITWYDDVMMNHMT